jgi:hypothetical protein
MTTNNDFRADLLKIAEKWKSDDFNQHTSNRNALTKTQTLIIPKLPI